MDAVDSAVAYAGEFCDRHHIDERWARVLILILEELITNTVSHGSADPSSLIEVQLRFDDSSVRLRYCDRGVRWDPLEDRPDPDFTLTVRSRPLGGMGWPLILHYSAAVNYRRDGDVNEIELVIPLVGMPMLGGGSD